MDRKRFEEIKAKVKAAAAEKAVSEMTVKQVASAEDEPKGKIFESVDAMLEYLNRKD